MEVVNPLAYARGKHKVVQIFWTLGDIPKHHRSQVDKIQLAMVVKEKLIKKYGYRRIYKQLISDLQKLENGIYVESPVPRLVKCGVLLHAGDNLESHAVGGFSLSFSSRSICRFCHIQHSDLVNRIHDLIEVPHKYWTEAEYDQICDSIEAQMETEDEASEVIFDKNLEDHLFDEEDEPEGEPDDEEIDDVGQEHGDESLVHENDVEMEIEERFGLRYRCSFNELKSFHAVISFPPDLLHDLLEGVVAQDLCGFIKIMTLKGLFTLEQYNETLKEHHFRSYEINDKPQPIVNNKAQKLPGKAVSIWLNMRSFGMIVNSMPNPIDENDEVFTISMKLAEITERLTATEFREYEIELLEEKIHDYLEERAELYKKYPNFLGTPKPKHHFLTHYGESIRKFGPPLAYWTGRFESKHRVAKGAAEAAKNFKNISLTLSVRQQHRMASKYYNGMFETESFRLPSDVTLKEALPKESGDGEAVLFQKLGSFMTRNDAICKEVTINSQKYKNGDIVVLKAEDDVSLVVGVIKTILVKPGKVFFVSRRYKAERNVFNFFVSKTCSSDLVFVNPMKQLSDFKPLVKYGTDKKFKFYLHHHISYDHE